MYVCIVDERCSRVQRPWVQHPVLENPPSQKKEKKTKLCCSPVVRHLLGMPQALVSTHAAPAPSIACDSEDVMCSWVGALARTGQGHWHCLLGLCGLDEIFGPMQKSFT